jgi:hypothetical protein
MKDYRKVDATHHLSSYEVILPIWNGAPRILKPFEPWKPARGQPDRKGLSLPWYQAYNASKHDRQDKFKRANFDNLVMAVAGLLALISSQFRNRDFSAGPTLLSTEQDYHPMEASIGSLFRIKYPEDWTDAELYDFDWRGLKTQKDLRRSILTRSRSGRGKKLVVLVGQKKAVAIAVSKHVWPTALVEIERMAVTRIH